eukprot:Skav219908  [mRNA]  locus=scaffold2667:29350:31575:+ [translate_table: standard]
MPAMPAAVAAAPAAAAAALAALVAVALSDATDAQIVHGSSIAGHATEAEPRSRQVSKAWDVLLLTPQNSSRLH